MVSRIHVHVVANFQRAFIGRLPTRTRTRTRTGTGTRTVKVFRIKDTLKETQRISAHKYRIVQGGEYPTPTLNHEKIQKFKKNTNTKM